MLYFHIIMFFSCVSCLFAGVITAIRVLLSFLLRLLLTQRSSIKHWQNGSNGYNIIVILCMSDMSSNKINFFFLVLIMKT